MGYPEKNSGSELSIVSKIISIADAFDAMTSTRVYRKSLSVKKATSIIDQEKGKQFDVKLSNIFMTMVKEGQINSILSHCGYEKPLISCPGCGPIVTYSYDTKDGDVISCPSCGGEFILHKKKDFFETEYNQTRVEAYIPQADTDTINLFTKKIPNRLKI